MGVIRYGPLVLYLEDNTFINYHNYYTQSCTAYTCYKSNNASGIIMSTMHIFLKRRYLGCFYQV